MKVSARSYLIAGVSLASAGLIVGGSNTPVLDTTRADITVAPMAATTTAPQLDGPGVGGAASAFGSVGAAFVAPAPAPDVTARIALPEVDGLDPEAGRPGVQLSLLTGTPNLGYGNEGLFNAGVNNDGDFNIGGDNEGNFNVGFDNRGGERNFGAGNTGSYNVGFFNTGEFNFGVGNTGVGNVGFFNTGDYTVGAFNVGIRYAGNPGISTGRTVADTEDEDPGTSALRTRAAQSEDDNDDDAAVTRSEKNDDASTSDSTSTDKAGDTRAAKASDDKGDGNEGGDDE